MKIDMKNFFGLNLKARFKNKVFVSSFVSLLAVIASKVALDFFGVDISETITSILEIVDYILMLLVMVGLLVDPTVDGFGDSDYSKSKDRPSDKKDKIIKEEGVNNKGDDVKWE